MNKLMKNHELETLIWKYFKFLKVKYKIIKIHQEERNVFWVNFEGTCNIQIHCDPWNEIDISIGRKGIPDEWEYRDGLEFIIYYLTQKKVLLAHDNVNLNDIENQFARYAKILKKYLPAIEEFTTSDDYLDQRKFLESIYLEAVFLQAEKINKHQSQQNYL